MDIRSWGGIGWIFCQQRRDAKRHLFLFTNYAHQPFVAIERQKGWKAWIFNPMTL
jgi:hypothetical protein